MIKGKMNRKIIAVFLTLNFLTTLLPFNAIYASNNGPNAPEAAGFEPVSATDMVNLSSGDMAYVLPLLDIDGFPVTLSYHAGIPMDMESSWIGLGWNINTGAISRGVVATPDDWKQGRRLSLTYLYGEQKSYTVNVGIGIRQAAEVGVGLSWGPNKAISGSVSAGVGPISITAETNGGVGISLNPGALLKEGLGFGGAFDKIPKEGGDASPFGSSLSYSNKGGFSASARGSIGGSSKGLNAGMGISVSGQGIGASFSVGYSNGVTNGTNAIGGNGSMSMNSFSAGDFSYNTKGIYLPITIGILNFGFGYQKTEIELDQAYNKYVYGSLYHNQPYLYSDATNGNPIGESKPDNTFIDYQKRSVFGDAYEQVIPQKEADFISDYRNQKEKLNFTFAGYDSYSINATGIGGALRPIIGQNSVIMGGGYDGPSTNDGNKKMKVFYHNSSNSLRTTKSIANNNLHFVLDGQVTENANMYDESIKNSYYSNNLSFGDFINQGTSINYRPKSGSYVEVFTNEQIDNGANIINSSASYNSSGSLQKRSDLGYQNEGIGAYRITTPDGKTYHFSQPVYQYEQIQHNYLSFEGVSDASKYNSSSKREATPYATHWLLTAITGPDFIDNGDNFPDKDDLGYWVRLEYGQWSSAYAWRSPYDTKMYTEDGVRKTYSTYIDNEVEKSDKGYFLQGRKDLYYLDKIVSKEQVAYFVKDLRYDAIGTDADYAFGLTEYSQGTNIPPNFFDDKLIGNGINNTLAIENAKYDKEYQLKLDKIVITKNENIVTTNPNQSSFKGLTSVTKDNRYIVGGIIHEELGSNARKHKLHQSNKVIDVDDFQNFDYSKASKVVKFNSNYSLAPLTPSSEHPNNPSKGRLTLNSLKFYGRGIVNDANESELFNYMPGYVFEYENPSAPYTEDALVDATDPYGNSYKKYERAKKDNWGFRNDTINGKNTVDAWSLNKITTPQGSTIEIAYEEDDFKIEAFTRNYWKKNLMYRVYDLDANHYKVEIINDIDNNSQTHSNFSDYFEEGQPVMLDLFLCRKWNSSGARAKIRFDVNPNDYSEILSITPANGNILNKLEIKVRKRDGMFEANRSIGVLHEGYYTNREDGWYSPDGNDGPNIFKPKPRGICPDDPGLSADHWSMKYTLLANKVAPGTSGGGLRVKEITVRDEQNNRYVTEYDYNDPNTGSTSGITSFNPTYGEVFVPYQNELPGPGVMYEWVTMKAYGFQGNTKKLNTSMRYRYYTLQPVWDIFNPNIDMKDIDGNSIFKTTVLDKSGSLTSQNKITAKTIDIQKNLSKIGQLISTEELNSFDQLLNKTGYNYAPRKGELRETFSSMKSVFNFSLDDEGNIQNDANGELKQRYIALSSKSEKVNVLKSIDNYAMSSKTSVRYEDPDPYLGTFLTSIKSMADGTEIKETKFPAYNYYSEMGSKILNSSYKNMLTQQAMNISSVKLNSQWKTINANITTWNNDWIYRDESGIESSPTNMNEKIWRKHKNFVWKEQINPDGTYNTNINDIADYFNWGTGSPTNNNWQNISEITRYTNYSSPIETKDINGNFASSKMADNWSKTIASGNARYPEMYYSGAEHILSGNNFEGEIEGANYRTSTKTHTGDYAIKLTSSSQKGFRVTGSVGANYNDLSKDFRPGTYKVSVWIDNGIKLSDRIDLIVNGVAKQPSEKVYSGNWALFNYYIKLNANSNVDIYFKNKDYNYGIYFDDFRMHPVSSSINSYVYDQKTDELISILDANNLAIKYEYDKAGRLIKIYNEFSPEGFKLVQDFNYNYKNQ
jgi:hypothetical protein